MTSQVRICVIGAGAAGICAAKHLSKLTPALKSMRNNQNPPNFTAVVFEKAKTIGGTWVYYDTKDDMEKSSTRMGWEDHFPDIHSSMYKNMHTNLPKEVMAYPDFPFPSSTSRSFLHHTEVQQYLEDYVKHFDLERFIRFGTEVISVKPFKSEVGKTTWEVQTRTIETNSYETHEFDGVMVCNGHYSVPNFPDISGLEEHFKGDKIHSHFYRTPEPFKDKVVLVLGAGASGVDIGLEITATAKKVYLSHNKPKHASELPNNMEQISGVVECIGDGSFKLNDSSHVNDVDVLLYCSGYQFSFPFLEKSCGIEVENKYTMVKPLHKHMININHPSMCFIGIPIQVCPFPQFDLQCQFYINFMGGIVTLPKQSEMEEAFVEGLKQHLDQGRSLRHYHRMGPLQWKYNRDIARIGMAPEIQSCVENLYNSVHERRSKYLMYYKNDRYIKTIHDNEASEYIRHKGIN